MLVELLKDKELLDLNEDEQLLTEVLAQVYKDFSLAGESFGEPDEFNSLEEIYTAFKSRVSLLLVNNVQQLANVLYRIDVDQNQLVSAMNEKTKKEQEDALSALVLKRELQKIVERRRNSCSM